MNRTWVTFVVLFALTFVVGTKVHQLTRERTAPFLVGLLNARAAAGLINVLSPTEHALATGNLIAGRASIQVGQGCDGIDCMLLLVAAMVAFPLPWRRRLLGLVGGVSLVYLCNLARIIALYEVQRHRPAAFDFMHEYVGQTFIILVGSCFFLVWSGSLARTE